MDRVEYLQSIDTGGLEYDKLIMNYFDQFMGLYGFMQPCNYKTKIIKFVENILLLEIEFTDMESSQRIMEMINSLNNIFSIYGRIFTFHIRVMSQDEFYRPYIIQMEITSTH